MSSMDDVKERIQNVTQELRSKGKLISGRTMYVVLPGAFNR